MRSALQHLSYAVGMWFVKRSGNAGAAAWVELEGRVAHAEQNYYAADKERWNAVRGLLAFRRYAETADCLLSAGMAERAQSQLRVGIIASREVIA